MPIIKSSLNKTVVAGDMQFPYADKKAIALLYEFLRDEQPNTIILNGDIIDFYPLSDYDRSPFLRADLENELKHTRDFLLNLKTICPNAQIKIVEGNHEFRLKKYLFRRAPDLAPLLTLEKILGLDALGIEYYGIDKEKAKYVDNFIEHEGFLVGHFNKVNQHSAYTAKAILEKYNKNIIQSHTHRAGAYYKRSYTGVLEAYEIGSLCSQAPHYNTFPNWQLGFALLLSEKNHKDFYQIIIKNNKFIWKDKLYQA